MGEAITLITLAQHVPLADSRAIAQALGGAHDEFLDLMTADQREIERCFGLVRFEIAEDTADHDALLTEDQAQVYLAYSQHRRARTYKQTVDRAFAHALDQCAPIEHEETQLVAWTLFLAQRHTQRGDSPLHVNVLIRASPCLHALRQHIARATQYPLLPLPFDWAQHSPGRRGFPCVREGGCSTKA